MFIGYDDIISRISEPPLWWVNGVPRYDEFHPWNADVYASEAVLVHTQCQSCAARFDVAVLSQNVIGTLRDQLNFSNVTGIGDPPASFHATPDCVGDTMCSEEIAILEFWERPSVGDWVRDPSMARALPDSDDWLAGQTFQTTLDKIGANGRGKDFQQAQEDGDYIQMVGILRETGSDRAERIAHVLDIRRRRNELEDNLRSLAIERFGPPQPIKQP